MRIKKYAAAAVMFLLFLITTAHADNVAEYEIKFNNYDAETKTYTADVYLNTTEYLSAGTFGMSYDVTLSPEFTLDESNFSYFRQLNEEDSAYIAFQWYLNDIESRTGKIHLGTITIENVILKDNIPSGWHTNTLRQLDWLTTSTSKEPDFILDKDGVCLNDEIWREFTDKEKETITDKNGYYQGYDMADEDNPEWVDIGFVFYSGYDLPEREGQTVSGTVQSYNPNNTVTVTLYKKDTNESLSAVDISDYKTVYPDGRVICGYELTEVDEGEYTLEIKKDVHLTYRTEVTVAGDDVQIGNIKLYCGDISADEKIKLDDRSILRRYLNKQISSGTAVRCDLNGDGKVTFHDLDILKTYYNKDYKGSDVE